jgi:hypothetical protein
MTTFRIACLARPTLSDFAVTMGRLCYYSHRDWEFKYTDVKGLKHSIEINFCVQTASYCENTHGIFMNLNENRNTCSLMEGTWASISGTEWKYDDSKYSQASS